MEHKRSFIVRVLSVFKLFSFHSVYVIFIKHPLNLSLNAIDEQDKLSNWANKKSKMERTAVLHPADRNASGPLRSLVLQRNSHFFTPWNEMTGSKDS